MLTAHPLKVPARLMRQRPPVVRPVIAHSLVPMDPLTTASDIIGLINGTNRILLALSGGPDRIDFVELSNEVRSYAATLKAVHNLLLQNESIAEQPALRDELEHGKRTLEYMAKMLEKYDNHLRPGGSGSRIKDSIMRIRWSLSREEISKIQADLRAHAARLGLLLNVAQMYVCPSPVAVWPL
jgi:hypothetical protein